MRGEGVAVIAQLVGQVVHDEADGTLVVDVHGVGYEVLAPLGTVGRLRAQAPQGPLTFHVHTHVREDAIVLFGFASPHERAVFRVLLGVSTVGPKTALAVLSALPPSELGRVVARKELGRLTSVPGVGKKIAERLLLELRDKLPQGGDGAAAARPAAGATPAAQPAERPAQRDQLVFALTHSGFKAHEAERVVAELGGRVDEEPLKQLLPEALRMLAK